MNDTKQTPKSNCLIAITKVFPNPPPPVVKREAPAPSPRSAKRGAGSFQKSQCENIIF